MVENREGKESGGYCEYIPKYNSPFIYICLWNNLQPKLNMLKYKKNIKYS